MVLTAGPTFTGDPLAPTPSVDDNDTSIATTAFVQAETLAGDVSGTLSTTQVDDVQTATANLEAADNNTTQVATTSFVQQELNNADDRGIVVASGLIAFDFSDAGADPGLAAEECRFSNEGGSDGGWVCEGSSADTIETRFRVTNPTGSDPVITFPNAGGTVSLLGTNIDDTDLENEDFGEFTCTGAEDGCTLDAESQAITELSDVAATTGSGTTVVFSAAPTFTGDTLAATPAVDDNDTSVATTAFVQAETFAGDVTGTLSTTQVDDVQTATANLEAANNDTTQVSTTSFVQQEINGSGGTGLTCATGTCNVDLGANDSNVIDGEDLAATVAGVHLVETAGAPDQIDVEASLIQRTKTFLLEDPATGDNAEYDFVLDGDAAATITRQASVGWPHQSSSGIRPPRAEETELPT